MQYFSQEKSLYNELEERGDFVPDADRLKSDGGTNTGALPWKR